MKVVLMGDNGAIWLDSPSDLREASRVHGNSLAIGAGISWQQLVLLVSCWLDGHSERADRFLALLLSDNSLGTHWRLPKVQVSSIADHWQVHFHFDLSFCRLLRRNGSKES